MIRSDWLLVLLTLLAVARLTRLVTDDVIARPFRGWVIRHRPAPAGDGPEDWLVYLIHCRWCASIWVSIPVAALVYLWPHVWGVQIGLLGLSASLAAALLAGLER